MTPKIMVVELEGPVQLLMSDYPRLFGDDLRNLLNEYDGEIQNIEFIFKSGYLSEAEYLRLAARGITSSSDYEGDIHDHLDLEGLDIIKDKEAELIGRIMSHKLGIPYEEWTKPLSGGQGHNESFEEILDCLKDAWWNDSKFYLFSYSPDKSRRVLINLVQETNEALYDEERQKIEVCQETLLQSNSTTFISCEDNSYTWYFLDESDRKRAGEISESEISGAVRDFLAQVEEIEGGPVEANGKEEQDTDALMSAINRFISS